MIEIANYTISRSDDKNLIIEQKKLRTEGDKAGTYVTSFCGYFPNLSVALPWLFHKMTSEALDEANSLDILAVRIEEIREEILAAVQEVKF